jgi:hypothetical protein
MPQVDFLGDILRILQYQQSKKTREFEQSQQEKEYQQKLTEFEQRKKEGEAQIKNWEAGRKIQEQEAAVKRSKETLEAKQSLPMLAALGVFKASPVGKGTGGADFTPRGGMESPLTVEQDVEVPSNIQELYGLAPIERAMTAERMARKQGELKNLVSLPEKEQEQKFALERIGAQGQQAVAAAGVRATSQQQIAEDNRQAAMDRLKFRDATQRELALKGRIDPKLAVSKASDLISVRTSGDEVNKMFSPENLLEIYSRVAVNGYKVPLTSQVTYASDVQAAFKSAMPFMKEIVAASPKTKYGLIASIKGTTSSWSDEKKRAFQKSMDGLAIALSKAVAREGLVASDKDREVIQGTLPNFGNSMGENARLVNNFFDIADEMVSSRLNTLDKRQIEQVKARVGLRSYGKYGFTQDGEVIEGKPALTQEQVDELEKDPELPDYTSPNAPTMPNRPNVDFGQPPTPPARVENKPEIRNVQIQAAADQLSRSGNENLAKAVLAIQQREGSLNPKTIGFKNNNPGNLRTAPNSIGTKGGFAIFKNYNEGLKALKDHIIKNGADKNLTILEYFAGKPSIKWPGYAPKADNNDPDSYARDFAKALGVTVNTPMSKLFSPTQSGGKTFQQMRQELFGGKK